MATINPFPKFDHDKMTIPVPTNGNGIAFRNLVDRYQSIVSATVVVRNKDGIIIHEIPYSRVPAIAGQLVGNHSELHAYGIRDKEEEINVGKGSHIQVELFSVVGDLDGSFIEVQVVLL